MTLIRCVRPTRPFHPNKLDSIDPAWLQDKQQLHRGRSNTHFNLRVHTTTALSFCTHFDEFKEGNNEFCFKLTLLVYILRETHLSCS